MSVETVDGALRQLIIERAATNDLLEDRVYGDKAPADALRPYVIVTVDDDEEIPGTRSDLSQAQAEVTIVAASKLERKQVSVEVQKALERLDYDYGAERWPYEVGSIYLRGVFYRGGNTGSEPTSEGSDETDHFDVQTYQVWYRELE